MKKILVLCAVAILLVACGGKTAEGTPVEVNDNTDGQTTTQTTQEKKTAVDSAYFHKEEGIVKCTLTAHLPAERMNQAVGEWLDEALGGIYPADPTDIQGIVDYYGKAMYDSLKAMEAEAKANEYPCPELAYEIRMEHAYETSTFVTYTLTTYTYFGGAHPSWLSQGATFRKQDGRRVDWTFIASNFSSRFQERVKTGLMEYFEVKTEDELDEVLQVDHIYNIPLPVTLPYFTEKGVSITYQQYEIAPYAAGLPSMIIPYDELKPMMTGWAQRMLK